ncbi:thioredoxin 2 [Oratosquilla oratoria]|uniref:thioredoxin 2 n=1 Tax=Oratosquilla oratoria TaxID=337810 RepID=UPI003F75E78C
MVYQVKDMADFDNQLTAAGSKLILVDFYATWCGPCKMIAPAIETLEQEMEDVVFLKVDVDQCDDIAAKYDISCMPTFIYIKGGAKLDSTSGADLAEIKKRLTTHRK